LHCYPPFPALHSFPTRRSSDLPCWILRVYCRLGQSLPIGFSTRTQRDSIDFFEPIRDHVTRKLSPEIAFQFAQLQSLLANHVREDRKSTRLNSSHRTISYAVFC